MQEVLHDHHTSIFIRVRPICNLRFSDDINLKGGSSDELQDLTTSLVDSATAFGMEVSTENSKIMTNSMNNISADIVNSHKSEEVTSFEYLGATLCKDGTCSAEVHIRIVSAIAAMTRLSSGATPSASQAGSSSTRLLSPPSSSVAVKHGPYLLIRKKDPGFRN